MFCTVEERDQIRDRFIAKNLEQLLATPTTGTEILLGKGISAALPPLVTILGCAALFMALMDSVTHGVLG